MHIMDIQKILVATHMAALNNPGMGRASSIHVEGKSGYAKSEGVAQSCEWQAKILGEPVALGIHMLAALQGVDMIGFMMPVKGPSGTLDTMFSTPPWVPTPETIFVVVPPKYEGPGGTDSTAASETPTWFPPGTWKGPLPRVGMVFFDEMAQAEDDVQKAASEVILNGRLGTRSLEPGYRVVSASNRLSDRSGVVRPLMHVVNRRALLRAEPHAPSWISWAEAQPDYNRPHYLTIDFARTHPEIVFSNHLPEGHDPFPTSRSLVRMDRDIKALRTQPEIDGDEMPLSDLAREFAAGWVGEAAAAQYYTHLKYADQLPKIGDIVADPKKAKLPERRDAQMVCAYMLAHHIADQTAQPIFTYFNRLTAEMQLLMVRVARSELRRSKLLQTTPGFSSWLLNNKELILAVQQ
jgi:hypothetical protein